MRRLELNPNTSMESQNSFVKLPPKHPYFSSRNQTDNTQNELCKKQQLFKYSNSSIAAQNSLRERRIQALRQKSNSNYKDLSLQDFELRGIVNSDTDLYYLYRKHGKGTAT